MDVYLPYVEFDEKSVVRYLETYRCRVGIPLKAKNTFAQMINMFGSITVNELEFKG